MLRPNEDYTPIGMIVYPIIHTTHCAHTFCYHYHHLSQEDGKRKLSGITEYPWTPKVDRATILDFSDMLHNDVDMGHGNF